MKERIMGDLKYRDNKKIITKGDIEDPNVRYEFNQLRTKIENVNSQIKNFNILKYPFRGELCHHQKIFNFICFCVNLENKFNFKKKFNEKKNYKEE
jgi:hypothetical protein